MLTQRTFLRAMLTIAPILTILQAVQGEYVLALYALALAPTSLLVAPYVCDDKR